MCIVDDKVILGTGHGQLLSWDEENLSLLTTIKNKMGRQKHVEVSLV